LRLYFPAGGENLKKKKKEKRKKTPGGVQKRLTDEKSTTSVDVVQQEHHHRGAALNLNRKRGGPLGSKCQIISPKEKHGNERQKDNSFRIKWKRCAGNYAEGMPAHLRKGNRMLAGAVRTGNRGWHIKEQLNASFKTGKKRERIVEEICWGVSPGYQQ